MEKIKKPYTYRTRAMPVTKAWDFIEKLKQRYTVLRDRSDEHEHHSELVLQLPAALFPVEDISVRWLHRFGGEVPTAWSKSGKFKAFGTQLFDAFKSATSKGLIGRFALKGVKDEIYAKLYFVEGKICLNFGYDARTAKIGPETNIVLRQAIQMSGLPIVLTDTADGFTIAAQMPEPVAPMKNIVLGTKSYRGFDCFYTLQQMAESMEIFMRTLEASSISINSLKYYIHYDNPRSGSNVLAGTQQFNDTIKKLNAIGPLSSQVDIGLSWGLNRYQDYQKLEALTKLVQASSAGISLFEFKFRDTTADLDLIVTTKGQGLLEFCFAESYFERDLEKEFGVKLR